MFFNKIIQFILPGRTSILRFFTPGAFVGGFLPGEGLISVHLVDL